MSILLPLYIYPNPGAWDPLYWVASNNPTLNLSVIINPCSGPCMGSLPEAPYLTEMPKLKNYANIRTLGYVATNYTNKPIDSLIAEIDTYAKWPALLNESRVAVDGIFFDETPGPYDWRAHDYLTLAKNEVKSNAGLGQQVIVHNPGTIPYIPWNYLDLADITVIFEDTYANFIDVTTFNALKTLYTNANTTTSAFALMLHTVPNIPDELIDWTVKQMKEIAGWSYMSSVSVPGEYWHSFSTIFTLFVTKYAARTV
ncbi:hypothetical protein K504DRAFT_405813 [Pleomassaria siparia CBS 279.74]|uniref:Spherulation-specific family 4 n=1 Tax=Pleomassaria siparia CBS 279.74 TaxID=1314801 RepID=A0A6G1KDM6_9PLEO|nr:hypothetical protein K504DRAFT_405813 [Pleomassaria siparia CBS 279.74]